MTTASPTPRIPCSTYRLQFNKNFTFAQAAEIAGYLQQLGITDCYASPILMARPGSIHGYDVIDHTRLNPELGTEDDFLHLSAELKKHGMGLIADVVPNHMCVEKSFNAWWTDVLENGPSSPFARFFDIDWNPPKEELHAKVLLPVLGDQFGRVLENQEIQIAYDSGAFQVCYYESRFPIAPRTWRLILRDAVAELRPELSESSEELIEMESIITALEHLPDRTETDEPRVRERQREKEVNRRRINKIVEQSNPVRQAIDRVLKRINGVKGDPQSFDTLERLLEAEAYRLSFWRVAADEINYRRFFDINELAAIRVEDPAVFSAVHGLILKLVHQGHITGLRVDHPDGLFDPDQYFRDLQRGAAGESQDTTENEHPEKPFYVVAEKILTGDEHMRSAWAISGTTGYDFLNLLNGVFVDTTRRKSFQQLYSRLADYRSSWDEVIYFSKRLVLLASMSSELNVLARWLDRISEHHRYSRDFTFENLRYALREVITCFPVYRTYTRLHQEEPDAEDRRYIADAVLAAKRRNPVVNASVFDFIGDLLLLRHPEGLGEDQIQERHMWVMRMQQLTGPVMAKGVEDTAFYRFYPLASLNEVGAEPQTFGVTLPMFHRNNMARLHTWPHSMLATSTHDTKRSEDVRARINVLSEMPLEWYRAVTRWQKLNRAFKSDLGGREAPSANEAYLLYQTLVGTWPLEPMTHERHTSYIDRIQAYMEKALHEAKVHTSWVNPNKEWDEAVRRFVSAVLEDTPENRFLADFREFQSSVTRAGLWNALSQVLLKIASPGVPDFYQGNEGWTFTLVDPDNRGAVDYGRMQEMLREMAEAGARDREGLVRRLTRDLSDGAAKLFLTNRALCFRREHGRLFSDGAYASLLAVGAHQNQVIAFARIREKETAVALAGRFFLNMTHGGELPLGHESWADTLVLLPRSFAATQYTDVISGRTIDTVEQNGKRAVRISDAFALLPQALLFSEA